MAFPGALLAGLLALDRLRVAGRSSWASAYAYVTALSRATSGSVGVVPGAGTLKGVASVQPKLMSRSNLYDLAVPPCGGSKSIIRFDMHAHCNMSPSPVKEHTAQISGDIAFSAVCYYAGFRLFD